MGYQRPTDETLTARILYDLFELEISQAESAKRLGISAAKVSKLVTRAERAGLVRYVVTMPQVTELSGVVSRLFPPDIAPFARVSIFNSEILRDDEIPRALGMASARLFEKFLDDFTSIEIDSDSRHLSVAIDGGKSVSQMIEAIRRPLKPNVLLDLYPIAGGPVHDYSTSVPALIGRFIGKYGQKQIVPKFVPEPHEFMSYVGNNKHPSTDFLETLAAASRSQIFVLGVGRFGKGLIPSETVKKLCDAIGESPNINSVGMSAYSAFDGEGQLVPSKFDKAICKLPWETIQDAARREDKRVLLVGCGEDKASAMRILVAKGCCNCLVTDSRTAQLMSQHRPQLESI